MSANRRLAGATRTLLLGAVLAMTITLAGAPSALAVPEYVYKLHLTVKGSEEVTGENGSEPSSLPENVTQKAEWSWSPVDTDVVLPRYEGPPGLANAGEKNYFAPGLKHANEAIGKVRNSGTYVREPKSGERFEEPYNCESPVVEGTVGEHHVIVTALNPAIEIETLFVGSLPVQGPASEFGPCGIGKGHFFFAGEAETGQRFQVGMTVEAAEIGQPLSISGPALDQSNVETSEHFTECGQFLVSCSHSFKLSGEYELEPVCEGMIELSAVKCTTGGSGETGNTGNTNNPPSNNPPAGGGGEKVKEEAINAESAATKRAEEEKRAKQHAEEAKAAIKIESIRLTPAELELRLKTSEPGTVTVTGPGLSKEAKSVPAGVHTLRVGVVKSARAHRRATNLVASLKVGAKVVRTSRRFRL